MKQGMNSVNRYLWDVLLYACMGCFSYFFLVHYADIPVRLQDRLMTFHTFLAVIVSFCGVGLSMRYINERLLTYYPYFLRNKRMLSAGLIAAAVILLLSNYLLLVSVKALAGVASPFHLQRSGLTVILLVWLVELVIVGQFILNRFYADVVRLYKRAEELEESTAEARYRTLQNQLNPHFLFNTLNNISSLVQIDQDTAQERIGQLSDLLRYTLYESNHELVPVEGEIEFMNNYIELMRLRCNELATVEVDLQVPPKPMRIVPLLFISLIENAFKHGVNSRKSSFVRIRFKAEGDDLVFTCENSDHPKPDVNRSGSGIGLENLRRRLDLAYPGRYRYDQALRENSYFVQITLRDCL
jgi:sensor histidine kinase YesM